MPSSAADIKLLVNQRFRADFALEVGSLADSVTVSANANQVESVSTQLGDVIEDKKMQNLPLNGRSFLDLLGLQAGVGLDSYQKILNYARTTTSKQ